jgi:hypothetical protein
MDFAASRFGMMSKFAAPFKRNLGKICLRKLSEMAASPCISPATSGSGAICSSNSRGEVARIIPDSPSFPDSPWQIRNQVETSLTELHLFPQLLQPLHRHNHGRLQFLRKQRHAQFLQ